MEKKPVGKVAHFFNKISVAIIELEDELNIGDKISIEGKHGAFEQTVDSMQIEHKTVETAKAGEAIGLKVSERAGEGDQVFKITE